MAGLLQVEDPDDAARGLPVGEQDLLLVLQDRQLDRTGQLVYRPDPMRGMLGDRILVNGMPTPTFDLGAGTYRLRLLNGSNARLFKLAWSDGRPMTVIGSDGGLLSAPRDLPFLTLAPAERAEVWVDCSDMSEGDQLQLESRSFSSALGGSMGMGGMGGGMMGPGGRGGSSLRNGADFPVCRFRVGGRAVRLPRPSRLRTVVRRPDSEVANLNQPRRFELSMGMMRFLLNGRSFDILGVLPNERIRLGVTEDWEFVNSGRMMAMYHPMHVHAGQFQIVGRTVDPAGRQAAATVDAGLLDEGWKDTVLVRPGERVRIRVRFDRHPGLFLYHCHILEHEDQGMMRNFLVEE
jgi:FtsP/CotA-like multicopper oxidase with cupredoxin domain